MSEVLESRERRSVGNYMDSDGPAIECFADMRKVLPLDDRAVQEILREVDMSDFTAMLGGSDSDVQKKN